ncbi:MULTISPECIES: response regulator transcription factor CarR [Vibrio]|jgi:two-component system, OmpR family, response regulator RstA|uniref:Response regulator n=1 Tax=Vibrio cholerae TaxID=666 RepID=A0A5C9QV38_VIBCL|nr:MULTISPECIES: response regulator transcription factor CarR [Vibrio]KQA29855.1 chemotaxis protein CheY [Vibrio paracholerae 877-163]EGR5061830.1 response regulator [Vibrio cholerae]EGS58644.1 response regulator [Vibrio paracholerae HE-09]ELJ8546754.1 response regulator transcription factor CarR [Vibrio cholerae]ELY5186264.1 response regulator transcription factor CarR [Vibrio cholerae]
MSNQPSLYIIEDDTKLREMLAEYMTNQGFQVTTFATGETAPEQILLNQPDLVLLDLMLPGENGLTICRQIRAQFLGKILMLTASDDDFDHVAALEMGADDFVNKPIKPRVLLARIRMLMRREERTTANADTTHLLQFGALLLNQSRRYCELDGEVINLSDSEFDLLWLLASAADQVVSREFLTKSLRGIEYDGLDRTVDNKIVTLRKKLCDDSSTPKRIITVRGKGYLFVPDTW